jgi:DNA-binding transcriptional MerR regulator
MAEPLDSPIDSGLEFLKVGALARRAGLTVRTLHHYEEIGLLVPARRTGSGHRLYGMPEVRRLHQITSLKQMGLSLDEIRASLDGDAGSLQEILDLQIRRLRTRIQAEEKLCEDLESLRDRLASGDEEVGLGELAESVGRTVRLEAYYTQAQLDTLERRAAAMGQDRIRDAQEEWSRIFRTYGEAMARGKPADHPDVLALARRSRELVSLFTGGDAGIRASLDTMFRTEDPERMMTQHGMPMAPGLWAYIQEAAAALAALD